VDPRIAMSLPARIVISLLATWAFAVGFAAGGVQPTTFDGDRAYRDLLGQMALGPRTPGSASVAKLREMILSELGRNGFTTGTQEFHAFSEVGGSNYKAVNVYGVFPKGAKARYLISAHYDCRPAADRDPDPAKKRQAVPGANDGASGVAVLLELSRVIPPMASRNGVALVFFDAEDGGVSSRSEGFCLGSRNMAANLPPALDFEIGVNLDMVGDANLRIPMEALSLKHCPEVTRAFWANGARLYPGVFVEEPGPSVYDDHMPFVETGRSYIDVIDFDYAPWHTTEDTADKCSGASLKAVGDTVLSLISR
jgi:glutaminyl-peptide cyclotransferase